SSQRSSLAVAHTGNIINAYELQDELEQKGSILQTSTDPELLAHFIKRSSKETMEEAIIESLKKIVGAYAFVMLKEDKMYVALDPSGIRPLSIGSLGDAYVIASETCAFNLVGATFEREVQPGELLKFSDAG